MKPSNDRLVHGLLFALMLFDITLVVWAFALPDLWFELFHTSPEAPDKAVLFLRRCGANWAAFALFQAIAWRRWKSAPVWLAVVAGVRFSDIFTDLAYALFTTDATWFNYATLPAMGVINLALGWFLLRAYRERRQSE